MSRIPLIGDFWSHNVLKGDPLYIRVGKSHLSKVRIDRDFIISSLCCVNGRQCLTNIENSSFTVYKSKLFNILYTE